MAEEMAAATAQGPACDQCRSRKVRCDRRRPECSNCAKAGACCDFSAQNRRPNPTKQLLTDFSQVSARLDTIETAIAGFHREFASFATQPPLLASGRHSPAAHSNTADIRHLLDRPTSAEPDPPSTADSPASPTSAADQFYRRWFKAAHHRLATAIQPGRPLESTLASSPAVLHVLRAKNDAFPFVEERHAHWPRGEAEPVAVPPRAFLDACIDVFLDEINVYLPVFDPVRLKDVVDAHYAEPDLPSDTREAWNLSFNNIILLAMCLSSRPSRSRQVASQGMEHDILQFFLRNALRGLLDLDRFSTHSLVNLQALTTLALVVREYHEGHVFAKLLPMICQLARNMGLQQSHAYDGVDDSPAAAAERKNLFWTLYRLDKQRCTMSGQPCDLYLFDSDIHYGGCPGVAPAMQPYTVASIYVMSMWEDIYLSLYSPRAIRRGQAHREEEARSQDASLQSWYAQNTDLLESSSADDPSAALFFRYELKYCFHVGKILVNRLGEGAAEKQRCVGSAKAALQIIEEVWQLGSTPSAIALLGRLFRCYPMAAFIELYGYILENPDTMSDASLLTSAFHALETLVHPHFPRVYLARLRVGMTWCLDVIELIRTAVQTPTPGQYASSSSASSVSFPDSTEQQHMMATSPFEGIVFTSGKRKPTAARDTDEHGSGNSPVRRKTAEGQWTPTEVHGSIFNDPMPSSMNNVPLRPAPPPPQQQQQQPSPSMSVKGTSQPENDDGPNATLAKSPFDALDLPERDFSWDELWNMDVTRLDEYEKLPQDWDYTFFNDGF